MSPRLELDMPRPTAAITWFYCRGRVLEGAGASLPAALDAACSIQHSKKRGPACTERMGVVDAPPRDEPWCGLEGVGGWRCDSEGIQSCGC